MDGSELIDLFAEVFDALDAAANELEQLSDPDSEWPLPADVEKLLHERDALAATLKTIPAGAVRDELIATYRREMKEREGKMRSERGSPAAVTEDVTRQLAAVFEVVRRRRIVESELHAALVGLPWRGGWAGC